MHKKQSKSNIFQTLIKFYAGFFPRRIQLNEQDKKLLALMFPGIKPSRLRFFDGMPWYMQHSFAIATALPAPYSISRVHIYFREYIPNDFTTLVTLVHEVYHAQQYIDISKIKPVPEFGFFRAFIWHYLGWFWAIFFSAIFRKRKSIAAAGSEAYRKHPLEITAYKHEDDFAYAYRQFLPEEESLEQFFSRHPFLSKKDSGYCNNAPPLWASSMAFIVSIFISITKPIIELIFLVMLSPLVLIAYLFTKKAQS